MTKLQNQINVIALVAALVLQLFYNLRRLSWCQRATAWPAMALSGGAAVCSGFTMRDTFGEMSAGRKSLEIVTTMFFGSAFCVFLWALIQSPRHEDPIAKQDAEAKGH